MNKFEDCEELGTGLNIGEVMYLDDENPKVEVDWDFLRMVISRLRILQKKSPDELARWDIPKTMEYIRLLQKK